MAKVTLYLRFETSHGERSFCETRSLERKTAHRHWNP